MKTLLFNPFSKYPEKTLLSFGILATIIGSYLAFIFSGRFDGIIDLHFVPEVTLWQPFIDNGINICCLTILLLIAAKYINKRSRGIDILTTATIARIPYYILPLFNSNGYILESTEKIISMATPENLPDLSFFQLGGLLVFALFTILFLVWYMILLFNGFKVASNAKGPMPVVLFVMGVLIAEVISKFLIFKIGVL